ncbi:MAG: hypothetical protein ACE5D4_06220 [Thermodesulfobacteriota bacterium]
MKCVKKKTVLLVLLVALQLSLFTVVSGCGKKAPPQPPEASSHLEGAG